MMPGCDDTGRYEDLVKPPALLRQIARRPPPTSFGVWLRAGVPVLGATALLPAKAFAATGGLESIPIVVLVAGLGLAVSSLAAGTAALTTLLRRSRDPRNE